MSDLAEGKDRSPMLPSLRTFYVLEEFNICALIFNIAKPVILIIFYFEYA